jgi:hypothetical protein
MGASTRVTRGFHRLALFSAALCAALGGFLAGTPKLAQVRYPPPAVVAFGHGAHTPACLAHADQVLHGGS